MRPGALQALLQAFGPELQKHGFQTEIREDPASSKDTNLGRLCDTHHAHRIKGLILSKMLPGQPCAIKPQAHRCEQARLCCVHRNGCIQFFAGVQMTAILKLICVLSPIGLLL